jgi:hypothetical protein
VIGWAQTADSRLRLHFGQAVEEAGTLDILEIRSTISTPSEAIAAVILLDQVTRDIYRGDQAVKVSVCRLAVLPVLALLSVLAVLALHPGCRPKESRSPGPSLRPS